MADLRELINFLSSRAYPRDVNLLNSWDPLIQICVVGGYAPSTPPIAADSTIACIGSCFAQEIATRLITQGRSVAHIAMSERWNTPFAARYFLEHAIQGKPLPDGFLPPDAAIKPASADMLRASSAFIVTLGLSVVWQERATGRIVMDIKGGSHHPKRLAEALENHVMRQTTVAENVEQIHGIIACIRSARATAPIIFTLSPIPLYLSLTEQSSVTANTVSKAAIRMAIHEVMADAPDHVYYWPSYEIIELEGRHRGPVWGQDGNDLRHLKSATIDDMMERFARLYFLG